MSHSFSNILIHGIFSTKNRQPLIRPDFEQQLYIKIRGILSDELCCPHNITNGTSNHIHILFRLSTDKNIQDVFKRIKGNTSHWINENNFIIAKFSWQTGYAAFSVSESKIDTVRNYILNQKEHHKKVSFDEEIRTFLVRNGYEVNR